MPLKIRRTRLAKQDHFNIWIFIAAQNVAAADNQLDRFFEAYHLLAEYPEAGHLRADLNGLRLYPVEHYNVLYRISPGVVEIIRVLHSARDASNEILTE
nr:type II toxin-antitoxin system RelE/ParE family toxin [uncultured Devosia sp.]